MKSLKISSISFLVFCSLVLVSPALAVVIPPKTPTGTATLIASVNIRDTKITSQKDNTINISFNITNGAGVQAGVKYGVKLVSGTAKTQVVVDEYVYPDVLSLSANSTLKKDIIYTAPANLTGDYTVMVEAKNNSGLPLGFVTAGKVKLASTLKTIQILPESCSLSIIGDKANKKYTLSQGINIDPTQSLRLTCKVSNSSKEVISAIPAYETHYISMYGDIVEAGGGDVASISFKASEEKSISLTLPKASNPQAYDVKVSLNVGNVSSNSIIAHYIISGTSATIQNFSLDKDSYKKGETAKLSLFSTSLSKTKDIALSAIITDKKQKACMTPINQTLTKTGLLDISAPIIANCSNPIATVILKDASGKILDQKVLSFESKTASKIPSTKSNMIFIIFGILVVLGLAVYFINLKKKSNEAINQ